MLIEAYGANGAIALSDRYSLDFLKSLISQTAKMRKTDEEKEAEREEEIITQKQKKFFSAKNKNRSVKVQKQDGSTKKISLAQFAVTPEQLLGVK